MIAVRDMLQAIGRPVAPAMLRAERRLGTAYPELLAELLDWAGNMRVTRGLSVNTVARYLEAVSLAGVWMVQQGITMDAMTAQLADDWQRDLFVRGRESGQNRALKLTALKQFYAWREERGAGVSPVRILRGPKKPKRIPKKFTRDELRAMFKTCKRDTLRGKRDYALLMFMLCTGARVSEVSGLEMEQLELRERIGRVKFFGKGARERLVSFERPLIQALMDWLTVRDELSLTHPQRVFCGLSHSQPGAALSDHGIQKALTKIKIDAELKTRVHPHKFRSTYATELYDQGFDLAEISVLLGHASVKTTMQYIAIAERTKGTRLSSRNVGAMVGERNNVPLYLRRKLKNHEQFPEG